MFLNPWYLQPDGGAAPAATTAAGGTNQAPPMPPNGSPGSSEGREGSPAPSLMSCGSQGSTVQQTSTAHPAGQHLYSIQVMILL